MDTKGLKTGQHVAFRQTFINTGVITSFGVDRNGRTTAKITGTCGSRGATTTLSSVTRIPGPHEVIISRAELKQLEANSDMLNRLEAAGVDNWEGYYHALSGMITIDEEADGE